MNTAINHIFKTYPKRSLRLLEVIPPFLSLLLISLPFWGSIAFPELLAYFIIFFDVYWFYKSLNLALSSFIASKRIKEAEKVNWLEKARKTQGFLRLNHLIIIPTYQESVEKLKETIEGIKRQTFPLKKIYIFIAMEEREKEAPQKAKEIIKAFNNVFGGLFVTYHPDRTHEIRGKSSNQAYAGARANETLIQKLKLNEKFLTVSSVDADSIFDRQYFSYLAYRFLICSNPYLRFWQSANVHYNNFWKVPSFTRVIAFFGSLWRASLLVQGLRLIPNSTYSLSFKLLKDIGYWDTDVIPEDYRIFFKAFFMKKGQVAVEPIYLKTSMDAAYSKGYMKSLMNKYHQERRWSWGISDDALYLKWWLSIKDIPFFKKTYIVGSVILDHILWPVNWFIITISANIVVLINPIFSRTTLGYNLPKISGFILTLCLFALFILILVDFNLRTANVSKTKRVRHFLFPLEFILMPVAGFFLSALPALMSHLQLIRGKRLEYKVTEKA